MQKVVVRSMMALLDGDRGRGIARPNATGPSCREPGSQAHRRVAGLLYVLPKEGKRLFRSTGYPGSQVRQTIHLWAPWLPLEVGG